VRSHIDETAALGSFGYDASDRGARLGVSYAFAVHRCEKEYIMNSLHEKSTSVVGALAPNDLYRATAVLVLAFVHDPVVRWQYPDPVEYLRLFPEFVRAFGGGAIGQGTARYVGEHLGVALWLPPGANLDHAAIEATLPPGRDVEIAAVLEQLASYHPTEPHWYLPLIGVDPVHQGKGYGAALLDDTLHRCDRDHVAAYLEATNPANIPFYERHGFKLRGTVQVAAAPPLFPMLRPAR
jgi:GNAT superfamily N-acetyltransferase